jgi:NADH dehydrogenase
VTVIDRTSHHLFQPLLYQVATGILSEGEIAPPTRDILRRQQNAPVLLGNVETIDLTARTVTTRSSTRRRSRRTTRSSSRRARASPTSATTTSPSSRRHEVDRRRARAARPIFGAYELAELEDDPIELDAWLTFVVVGRRARPASRWPGRSPSCRVARCQSNFRRIDPSTTRVVLLDAADAVLGTFGDALSEHAKHELEGMGVEVQLGAMVVDVDRDGIEVRDVERQPARASRPARRSGPPASPPPRSASSSPSSPAPSSTAAAACRSSATCRCRATPRST